MSPPVTVVIPNYNHARFLPRRVESVLGQTFGDFELLLLDDASTDDSLAVLRRYAADPRVRVVANPVNSGSPFRQWNRGVAEARGEFVWLAESDDYADPTLLARLVGVLRRHPGCGVAYCQSREVDADGRVGRTYAFHTADLDPPGRWAADFVLPGPAACGRYLSARNVIPNASAVVFRRAVYQAAGGADPTYRVLGDWKLWVDMLAASDLGFVADPLNYFRHHRSNVRRQVWASGQGLEEWARALREIGRRHPVPAAARRGLADTVAGEWLGVVRHGSVSWPRALELWRQLGRAVPGLNRSVARRLLAAAAARATGRRRPPGAGPPGGTDGA